MKQLTLFALALAVCSIAAVRSHASIQYTFRGVVPAGAIDNNANVAIGESWIATFLIDDSVLNTGTPTIGLYQSAVLGGTLRFSGGYVSPLNFTGMDVEIYKTGVDAVHIVGYATDDLFNYYLNQFQVVATSGFLPDTSLPPAGTVLGPDYSGALGYMQLNYNDSDGKVEYATTSLVGNVSFEASAVPEPMSLLVWTALGGSIAAVYSYRRATK